MGALGGGGRGDLNPHVSLPHCQSPNVNTAYLIELISFSISHNWISFIYICMIQMYDPNRSYMNDKQRKKNI